MCTLAVADGIPASLLSLRSTVPGGSLRTTTSVAAGTPMSGTASARATDSEDSTIARPVGESSNSGCARSAILITSTASTDAAAAPGGTDELEAAEPCCHLRSIETLSEAGAPRVRIERCTAGEDIRGAESGLESACSLRSLRLSNTERSGCTAGEREPSPLADERAAPLGAASEAPPPRRPPAARTASLAASAWASVLRVASASAPGTAGPTTDAGTPRVAAPDPGALASKSAECTSRLENPRDRIGPFAAFSTREVWIAAGRSAWAAECDVPGVDTSGSEPSEPSMSSPARGESAGRGDSCRGVRGRGRSDGSSATAPFHAGKGSDSVPPSAGIATDAG